MKPNLSSLVGPANLSTADRATQVFDGFPYLVVRMGPAVYLVIPVPKDAPREELIALARHQAVSNRLSTCLAFGLRDGVYCEADGSLTARELIPRGGTQITGPLRLGRELGREGELRGREERLRAYLRERHPRPGVVMGDLEKGGREPSPEERERLGGAHPAGVPRGLARCATCGEWRGECLDPNPRFGGLLVRVSCRCENENRCARCGGLLHEQALNSNYYDEGSGRVMHVAGFVALGHRCGRGVGPDALDADPFRT